MPRNDNISNGEDRENYILSAKLPKSTYRVTLKLHPELEELVAEAAKKRGLTPEMYIEVALREKLKADQIK